MSEADLAVISGASGHIGARACEFLLARGIGVRAVARTPEKLQKAAASGAEPFPADLSDPASAERALSGARAAFLMIPPNAAAPDVLAAQRRFADSYVRAIRTARVPHVVALSSVGAHRSEGMGPVNGLHDWEEKLRALGGTNVLILRPVYFMENLLASVPLIKGSGIMGSALDPDTPFPMIATQDIAAAVADALARPSFSGLVVRELHGQRDITLNQARAAIADAVDMPTLKYVRFPDGDAEKAMVGMGLSSDYARLLIEMSRSMNAGAMAGEQPRSAASTTPTSIEAFARQVVAPAVKMPAPAGR